ncbi:hypothetical protein [Desertibaculum subflavum]|uniref:hypothetical protein n=1 Tax=Desertibaculum subflavum TaxID=2268458 RepID=UPI000E66A3F6
MITDYLFAALVTVLALVGILLAAFADDAGIYIFGLGMAAFGTLFDFWLIRRHFDAVDAARRA